MSDQKDEGKRDSHSKPPCKEMNGVKEKKRREKKVRVTLTIQKIISLNQDGWVKNRLIGTDRLEDEQ